MRAKLFLIGLFLLSSFSAIAAEEALEPEKWKDFVSKLQDSMEPVDELGELSVPLLQPAKPVSKWENARLHRSKNGGYWIIYSNPDPKRPFERVIIVASPEPIPALASVPDESVEEVVNGDLGVVKKPQSGKTLAVKWKTPGGPVSQTIHYFRRDSGGGADGPLDSTDAFSLTVGGKTGYYVVSVESITGQTEKRIKSLEVLP
jgi:hypothetical protein